MRPTVTALILLLILGCKRQQDQIEKFIFDNSQVNTKQVHKYTFFTDGKIKIDKSIIYTYMAEKAVDSMVFTKEFFYNKKGKIERIIELENGDKELKVYNAQDSLIGNFKINKENDTTFSEKTFYENGKKTSLDTRWLRLKLPDFENPKKEALRSFDTLLTRKEFLYQNDLISKTIVTEQGKLQEEVLYFYKDGVQYKKETYSFLKGLKYLKETTTFNLKNNNKSDFVAINNEGDTSTVKETIRQENTTIIATNYKSAGIQIIEYYNEKNQLIGTIDVNLKDKIKNIASISYDNKGNIIEESSYRQRLNDFR
ncbi:hypothetical protein GM921_17120 [Pedobacter sp. LMG 31464]|uniref:Uncharacterized protein n=1 Tax=Pedobacter planticolens TaxID=2679964 RepID=A0A923IVP4_9SPHI|nr:hypothetical protein [Pedobacter planticolens]MBB2147225.1 hypothetical protein [Pedobacter planticolens]